MKDTFLQIKTMAQELANLRAYFGEETETPKELLAFLRKTRDQARTLSESLFVDNPVFASIASQLDILALACDLCLRTYSGDDGLLSHAESALLEMFDTGSPWRAVEPGSLSC